METFLVVYTICAVLILIWSTLRDDPASAGGLSRTGELQYIVTSGEFFSRFLINRPDLIVMDLRWSLATEAPDEAMPFLVRVSTDEIRQLVKWLPPATTLVFLSGHGLKVLDAGIESILRELRINPVYLLDCRDASSPTSHVMKTRRAEA